MGEVLTARQMRAIEGAAIASGSVSGAELMERAGMAVVDAITCKWPEFAEPRSGGSLRATVLCGPGNNGGDGFVVARLLAQRGWTIRVLLHSDVAALPRDARLNHDRWAGIGSVGPLNPARETFDDELVIDALFGIGLTRPFDAFAGLMDSIRQARSNEDEGASDGRIGAIVAIDVPSGLCADSGRLLSRDAEAHPAADLTVTFHALKPGHLLADGPRLCGKVAVASIGLGPVSPPGPACAVAGPGGAVKRQGNKFDHGHALILAGAAGSGGAARLAARAALRAGAGLVTMGCPAAAMAELSAPPDALMRRCVDGTDDLAALLQDQRINAVCLGPAAGLERAEALLRVLLPSGRACVLDADALTALSRRAEPFDGLHDGCVLTPHMGEFARLFPDLARLLADRPEKGPAFSRLDAAREASRRSGAVVLLKGPDTVIAAPGGDALINAAFDVPWLATAGAGDVLAGIIAGLLGRGFAPLDAAGTGAWLHAAAARAFGPGLIADDIPEALPRVFRDLDP